MTQFSSALNTAGGIARSKSLDLCNAHLVKVMLYRMFQAGSRHGKVDGLLIILSRQQRVDQTAAEAIAAADAINDTDMIGVENTALSLAAS